MTAMPAFDAGDEPQDPSQVRAAHALRLRDAIGTAASLAELADLITEVIDLQVVGELVTWPDAGFVSSTMPLSALIARRRFFLKHTAEPPSYGMGGRR